MAPIEPAGALPAQPEPALYRCTARAPYFAERQRRSVRRYRWRAHRAALRDAGETPAADRARPNPNTTYSSAPRNRRQPALRTPQKAEESAAKDKIETCRFAMEKCRRPKFPLARPRAHSTDDLEMAVVCQHWQPFLRNGLPRAKQERTAAKRPVFWVAWTPGASHASIATEHGELVMAWLWSEQAALALHGFSDVLPAQIHLTLRSCVAFTPSSDTQFEISRQRQPGRASEITMSSRDSPQLQRRPYRRSSTESH